MRLLLLLVALCATTCFAQDEVKILSDSITVEINMNDSTMLIIHNQPHGSFTQTDQFTSINKQDDITYIYSDRLTYEFQPRTYQTKSTRINDFIINWYAKYKYITYVYHE